MNQKTEKRYHETRPLSRRGDAGKRGETENWRAVLELQPDDLPKPDQMRSTGQILSAMMRRGMLDALDDGRPATTPK
jgi:hypothetical protein